MKSARFMISTAGRVMAVMIISEWDCITTFPILSPALATQVKLSFTHLLLSERPTSFSPGPTSRLRLKASLTKRKSTPQKPRDQAGRVKKRTGSSGTSYRIDWEKWKPLLYELYVKQNLSAQQVETAIALKQLKVSYKTLQKKFCNGEWPEFKKNKSDLPPVEGQAPRHRPAKSLPPSQEALSRHRLTRDFLLSLIVAGELENPRPCSTPPAAFEADACRHTETMLRCINNLVKGIFDQRKSSSPSSRRRTSPSWQLVYDKCHGLAGIKGMMVQPGKLWFLWHQLLDQLGSVAATQARTLAFLTQFWRICACLMHVYLFVRIQSNASPVLRVFLSRLKTHFLATMGKRDDLVVLVESLLGVLVSAPLHLKTALGIGCLATMDGLSRMVGCSDALILKMASCRFEHWKPDSSSEEHHRLELYRPLLDGINAASPTQSDIEVLSDFTLSQRYSNPQQTPKHAALLYKLALEQCRAAPPRAGGLKYNQSLRALAYSAELLAVCNLDPVIGERDPVTGKPVHNVLERDRAFQRVADAIDLLRRGDLECRVRAVHLSKRLSIWFKTYFPGQAKTGRRQRSRKMQQRHETSAILAQIDELTHVHVGDDGSGWGSSRDCTHERNAEGKSKNNRWRREVRERQQTALHDIVADGRATVVDGAAVPTVVNIKGPRAPRVEKARKEKGPAQTPPTNLNRLCRHCGQSFVSRNMLFRHVKEPCAEKHQWALV
ncbi:hypothetical protein B0T24DRAFT_678152 [Lasiosphaeria ovina]|uniref:C2H2-type domain-containing protein n=1 Tax=Lasiosphaeria ovina TaxID=92902 RepID=A0AAE0NAZ6_9PEZI|nr:hypothetical protein B0T24DRAFT_678152 [Lasiosphaeria ovina]